MHFCQNVMICNLNDTLYFTYVCSISNINIYLAQLGLGVHKDLAHFTLEVLAGHPDAAFAAQPLALAPGTGGHHLPPAPRQDTVTLQHQFVLRAWRTEQRGGRYVAARIERYHGRLFGFSADHVTITNFFTAVMCFQLGGGVDSHFTNRTMEVSLALLGLLVLFRLWLPVRAGRVRLAARLSPRGLGGLRGLGGAGV